MVATLNKPALSIADAIAQGKAVNRYEQKQLWFTGDTSETTFTLTEGFRPFAVFSAGLLQKEGVSDQYTVTSDAGIKSVEFASAPAAVDVCVVMEAII